MGALETVGCVCVVFGPALGVFAATIARDPLRVIIFVLGAFFYLVGLLLSALLWFAVVPLRADGAFVFGLFVSVALQEAARASFYLVLAKARAGLERVSSGSLHIAGVHSLGNKHLLALVSGLGFGVMAACFSTVNLLADAAGPGTVGFPLLLQPANGKLYGDFSFTLTSCLYAAAMSLLHVAWTVLMWEGQARFGDGRPLWWLPLGAAVAGHFLVSGLSLINASGFIGVSLAVAYTVLLASAVWAAAIAGATPASLKSLLTCVTAERTSGPAAVAAEGAGQAGPGEAASGDAVRRRPVRAEQDPPAQS